MLKYLLWIGFVFWVTVIPAQEMSNTLTKNFKFEDGVYLSFEDFQQNRPSYLWEDLHTNLFVNPQTFIGQVFSLDKKNKNDFAPLLVDSLWGFTIGGIPYMRFPEGTLNKSVPVFVGLRVRGKICYLAYEEEVEKKVLISAYNPLTNVPFRQATLDRYQKVKREWMLDFKTGERIEFNSENFRNWIQDDPKFLATIDALTEEELKEKLFKCLLIYVDRNEVKTK